MSRPKGSFGKARHDGPNAKKPLSPLALEASYYAWAAREMDSIDVRPVREDEAPPRWYGSLIHGHVLHGLGTMRA
jgi:hypothetical protein